MVTVTSVMCLVICGLGVDLGNHASSTSQDTAENERPAPAGPTYLSR